MCCLHPGTVYFHFSVDGVDSHVDRPRPDEGNVGKVDRKPEEFVISAEDLSNPFAVFGRQRTAASHGVRSLTSNPRLPSAI